MSRFRNIHTIKSHILRSAVIFTLGSLMFSSASQATLVPFEPHAWDAASQHIYRNGVPITEPATNVLPGTNFSYVQEIYKNQAIGFSGAEVHNPNISTHIFSYTTANHETSYLTTNTTGHTRRFVLEPEDLGLSNLQKRKIKLKSDIILNGSLLHIKDPESDIDFSEMDASFKVLVTREDGKKLFKGSVQLKTNKKGKVKVKTTGKIKKKYIGSDEEGYNGIGKPTYDSDSRYQIDFVNIHIPYKYRVKFGEQFTLITEVVSNANNKGNGTGAEVIFGPGVVPTLPTYQEQGIPEPSTIILLGYGGLLMLRPNSRKFRFGSRRQSI